MSIQEPSGLSVSGRTTTESTDNGISRTRIFDLLSNERRVYILEYLADHDGHSTFKQIVEGVASREYETDTISSAERNRVYASLSQTHIPTLTEEGVIEYDSTSGAVSLADGASAVLDYLRPPGPLQHLFRSVTSALSA